MKIVICDICKHQDDKQVEATWTLRQKNRMTGESIKLDACTQHKDFFKDCKNVNEARTKVHDLVGLSQEARG